MSAVRSNSTWFVIKARPRHSPDREGCFPTTTGTWLSRSSSPRTTWRRRILVRTDRTSHDPQVRDEALKTLYRLRATLGEREEPPSSTLKAIESLIAEYEQERSHPDYA